MSLLGTTPVANGGTGLTSLTAGSLVYGNGTSAYNTLAIGSANQILTSTGTAPQWSTLSGVAVTTFSGGTTGLTPSTATSGAITLAGVLNAVNGGTGEAGTLTGILYGNGTSAHTVATNAQLLTLLGTLGVPNGGTGLTTLTSGYIPYGNGTSAFASSSNLQFSGSALTVTGSGTFTTGVGGGNF